MDMLSDYMERSLNGIQAKDILDVLANKYLDFAKENYNLWSMLFDVYRCNKPMLMLSVETNRKP